MIDKPKTLSPEVREAATAWFLAQKPHDLRALYRLIMTSILYRQSGHSATGDDQTPAWLMGPMKMMDPEQFLDTTTNDLGLILLAAQLSDPQLVDAIA